MKKLIGYTGWWICICICICWFVKEFILYFIVARVFKRILIFKKQHINFLKICLMYIIIFDIEDDDILRIIIFIVNFVKRKVSVRFIWIFLCAFLGHQLFIYEYSALKFDSILFFCSLVVLQYVFLFIELFKSYVYSLFIKTKSKKHFSL